MLVSVASKDGAPQVIDRRRVELIDAGLPNQPYHHEATELAPAEAQTLVDRVKSSVSACARRALAQLRGDLSPARLVALAIREGPSPAIPDTVAEVLRSYRAMCAADGEMYRRELCGAATELGLEVALHPRKAEVASVARVLHTSEAKAQEWIGAVGSELGPPWREDHRRAVAAAIAALARHVAFERLR